MLVVPPVYVGFDTVGFEVPPVNHSCFWRFAINTFDPPLAMALSSRACAELSGFGIVCVDSYIIRL